METGGENSNSDPADDYIFLWNGYLGTSSCIRALDQHFIQSINQSINRECESV
jgi:hypothetical protein